MTKTVVFNLRSFRQKARHDKRYLRYYLTRLEKKIPRNADQWTARLEKEVWSEMDCLLCANCCKQMSPTYTASDLKRISAHLEMTTDEFKKKWLYKDRTGDWMNKSTPCQFLDLKTNMCSIYAVRPGDCAGFPHLSKKRLKDYIHIHKQNVEYCPATYKMVNKMMAETKAIGNKR
ncbi:MAG: YkgJ family cysteine cluster protein [Chitinophagaceae bacterium]